MRAIEGKALEALKDNFRGPIAVAYIHDDPVALAKTLTEFAKEVPKIEFRGGVVEGRAIAADQVQDIARLPSREELIAKLLFLLQSPITRLARGLAAIPQQMVIALDQIAKQKAEQG
ncbi:MAG: 50S ribosomal protein L10 [Thermoanaerobaculia bacterium]|nr:50S ribosomal protein L10 [Thermoanaerobaculia bacterium]